MVTFSYLMLSIFPRMSELPCCILMCSPAMHVASHASIHSEDKYLLEHVPWPGHVRGSGVTSNIVLYLVIA